MNKKITRREMFRYAGLAGMAALLGSRISGAAEAPPPPGLPKVPRRVLGKTKETVPVLLMGGAMRFDQTFDPKLAECLRFGVNYFDTADCYAGGTSEIAIGNFLEKTGKRNEVWITTKSDDHTPSGLARVLDRSLERLKTKQVDMLFLHALKDPRTLSPEVAQAAEQFKKAGKIRFFGFSCHDSTVAELISRAAEIGWIDAVMFRYNFREYGNTELNRAMDAAHKAGVGLIAMKTQGSAVSFEDSVNKFTEKSFTRHQAVLKAVWADERISAAVSQMDTLEKIKSNVAAALDKTSLAESDIMELQRYADATRHLYCAGCQHICNAAVPAGIEVGTTLRYLMYHDNYGDRETARQLFAQLPESARRFDGVDFSKAAALCPRHVDIARHMRRAAEVLA